MIRLENVSKSYGGNKILDSISCEFETGKIYAVTGASGIGKTTLLRVMSSLEKFSGKITGLENMKKSFLFPEDRLIDSLNALENIRFVKPDFTADEQWFDDFGLSGAQEMYPNEMSTGMKRRLSLMRALVYGGDVFFLDEPTNGLDGETAARIRPVIKKCLDGKTAFIVTHSPDDIAVVADYATTLHGTPVNRIELKKHGTL